MRKKNGEPKKILSLGSLNCHGLIDKVDLPEFHELVSETDILGVSETWVKTKADIKIPGYEFFPINRTVDVRGGIGVFISNKIKEFVKIRHDISDENFLWCKINKEYTGHHENIYMCIVYIPPEASTREKKNKCGPLQAT